MASWYQVWESCRWSCCRSCWPTLIPVPVAQVCIPTTPSLPPHTTTTTWRQHLAHTSYSPTHTCDNNNDNAMTMPYPNLILTPLDLKTSPPLSLTRDDNNATATTAPHPCLIFTLLTLLHMQRPWHDDNNNNNEWHTLLSSSSWWWHAPSLSLILSHLAMMTWWCAHNNNNTPSLSPSLPSSHVTTTTQQQQHIWASATCNDNNNSTSSSPSLLHMWWQQHDDDNYENGRQHTLTLFLIPMVMTTCSPLSIILSHLMMMM